MAKKAKKLLATLLAASMIMSMVSMTAFAKEPEGEEPGTNPPVVGEDQSEPEIENESKVEDAKPGRFQ